MIFKTKYNKTVNVLYSTLLYSIKLGEAKYDI